MIKIKLLIQKIIRKYGEDYMKQMKKIIIGISILQCVSGIAVFIISLLYLVGKLQNIYPCIIGGCICMFLTSLNLFINIKNLKS